MMRDYYYPLNNWMCGGNFFGGYVFIFWILLIGIILMFAFKPRLHQIEANKESASALNILKERYAKGDITKKEFEDMKKDIS